MPSRRQLNRLWGNFGHWRHRIRSYWVVFPVPLPLLVVVYQHLQACLDFFPSIRVRVLHDSPETAPAKYKDHVISTPDYLEELDAMARNPHSAANALHLYLSTYGTTYARLFTLAPRTIPVPEGMEPDAYGNYAITASRYQAVFSEAFSRTIRTKGVEPDDEDIDEGLLDADGNSTTRTD